MFIRPNVVGTSALGNESVSGDANVTETGVTATSGLGTVIALVLQYKELAVLLLP
jgi:hypothetical protein